MVMGHGDLSRDQYLAMLAFRDRMEARFAKMAARFDQSGQWAFDGALTPQQWLHAFGRLALDDARRLLTLGAACRQCEAHHVVDWVHDGHTRPDNLVLLCSRHHHILHLNDWHHTLHPDNTLTVQPPLGVPAWAPG